MTPLPPYRQLIASISRVNRLDEAARLAVEWVTQCPDDGEAHAIFAWVLLLQGKMEQGEEQLRTALAVAPDWAEAHRLLAQLHFDRREYQQAHAAIQQCVRLEPETAEYHRVLAATWLELGNIEQAIAAARVAVAMDPDDGENQRLLCVAEHRLSTSDADGLDMLIKLQAALALDANSARIQQNMAEVYVNTFEDFGTAEGILLHALADHPTDLELHNLLTWVTRRKDVLHRLLVEMMQPMVAFLRWVRYRKEPTSGLQSLWLTICLALHLVHVVPWVSLWFVPTFGYFAMKYLGTPPATTVGSEGMNPFSPSRGSLGLQRFGGLMIAATWWIFLIRCFPAAAWWIVGGVLISLAAGSLYLVYLQQRSRQRVQIVQRFLEANQFAFSPTMDELGNRFSLDRRGADGLNREQRTNNDD